jgi:hypothetical protein
VIFDKYLTLSREFYKIKSIKKEIHTSPPRELPNDSMVTQGLSPGSAGGEIAAGKTLFQWDGSFFFGGKMLLQADCGKYS